MNQIYGYIYIRNHPSYHDLNACKLGKTTNIPDRDTQYATGEIKRGCHLSFQKIFITYIHEIPLVFHLCSTFYLYFFATTLFATEFFATTLFATTLCY